jgi:CoA:oxalate CoA-transferase
VTPDPAPEGRTRGALAGLRVLDIANLLPAPLIAAMLGDFGADVVKVEPPGGDGLRFLGFARDGHSLPWALAGRNKRTVVLDPESDDGRVLLQQLTDAADVVIVNQPSKVLDRWGCTYEAIAARNPACIFSHTRGTAKKMVGRQSGRSSETVEIERANQVSPPAATSPRCETDRSVM